MKNKKIALTVATVVIMAGMLRGNTAKVYADVIQGSDGKTYFVSYGSPEDEAFMNQLVMQDLAQELGGNFTFNGTPYNGATASQTSAPAAQPAQQTAPAAPAQQAAPEQSKTKPTQAPKEETPKENNKVTAKFKNMYGVIIGTSKITKGTDIAKSQFPKSVPDITTTSGKTYVFDHWDYDGSVLTEDISVKAVFHMEFF